MHNDNVYNAVAGSHITDVDVRENYASYGIRQRRINHPDDCISNADSYTWLSLEVFWTKLCLRRDRFKDSANPRRGMSFCPTISSAGWCGCGSAGNFPGQEPLRIHQAV